MHSGRFALDAAFVVGFFFAFLFGGFLFEAFFGQSFGVQMVAANNAIDSWVIEFVISVAVVLGSHLFSWKKHGRDRCHLLLLGSISLFAIDSFVISTGMAFPILMQDFTYAFYLIFVLSLAGIIYGIRRVVNGNKKVESVYLPKPYTSAAPMKKQTILLWSILIASVAGTFGLTTLNEAFGMYMEPPPPLLGQPLAHQILEPCNQAPLGVCPPLVVNNIELGMFDFTLCFLIAFIGAYLILLGLASTTSRYENSIKRNVVPIVLLVITLLFVSLSVNESISSGASLSQPHWPTPSGITFSLGNISLYAGGATTSTSEGAHIDLRILNYHWTPQTITLSFIQLKSSNGTAIYPSIFECQSASSCETNSSFVVAPYSATVVPFYIGSSIQQEMLYSYNFTISSNLGEWITSSSPPSISAS